MSRPLPKDSRACTNTTAAFVSPEQPVQSFESLAALPSEQIHIGSQVGRVYRLVKKKSRQGSLESKEELAVRQSSPKSWTVAYIPTPEAFALLPTAAEVVVNTQIQWGLPPSLQQLVGLPIQSG